MLRRFTTPPLARASCTSLSQAAYPRAAALLAADARFKSAAPRDIQFNYRTASGVKRNMLKDSRTLLPVNEWTWKFAQRFAELEYDPLLSLPKARKMLPAMEVFAQLDIDEKILGGGRVFLPKGPLELSISETMRSLGYGLVEAAPYKIDPSLSERELRQVLRKVNKQQHEMSKRIKAVDSMYAKIVDANRQLVRPLSELHRMEAGDERASGTMFLYTRAFLRLCAFDDGHLDIVTPWSNFRLFGKDWRSDADISVVKSVSGGLILLVIDTAVKKNGSSVDDQIWGQGHLGQIVGEMLQLLSLNRDQNIFRPVFALRFINERVTAFRIDADKRTLATLVETPHRPEKKLLLRCTHADPTVDRGWSLIDKDGRAAALHTMANIRRFLLNNQT